MLKVELLFLFLFFRFGSKKCGFWTNPTSVHWTDVWISPRLQRCTLPLLSQVPSLTNYRTKVPNQGPVSNPEVQRPTRTQPLGGDEGTGPDEQPTEPKWMLEGVSQSAPSSIHPFPFAPPPYVVVV